MSSILIWVKTTQYFGNDEIEWLDTLITVGHDFELQSGKFRNADTLRIVRIIRHAQNNDHVRTTGAYL